MSVAKGLVQVDLRRFQAWAHKEYPRGEVTPVIEAFVRILLNCHNGELRKRFQQRASTGSCQVEIDKVHALAHELGVSDVAKFVATMVVDANARSRDLRSANPNLGEIEILATGRNLLADEAFEPANKYVSVSVDSVVFRQEDKQTGVSTVRQGKYVYIDVPSGRPGAVVLPVDCKKQRVLLVAQYRHPQGRFLTEAPRGFGDLGIDFEAIDTARRELEEETGAIPIRSAGVEQLIELKSLYTDTGKLAESPVYYLALVDSSIDERRRRKDPLMENPVWVDLSRFYEAVFARVPIVLGADEFEFCLGANRSRFFAKTALDDGLLQIEDGFTTLAALLARPHLVKRFPALSG